MQQRSYDVSNGQRSGPVSSADLQQLAATGQLAPDDLVRQEGLSTGAPARTVEGLAPPDVPPLTTPGKTRVPLPTAEGLSPADVPVQKAAGRPPAGESAVFPLAAKIKGTWRRLSGTQQFLAFLGVVLAYCALRAVAISAFSREDPKGKVAAAGDHEPVPHPWPAQDPGLPPIPGLPTPPARAQNPWPAQNPGPAVNAALVGTWVWEHHTTIRGVDDVFVASTHRRITINADGSFTDKSDSGASFGSGTGIAEGQKRGKVAQQGYTLVFTYSDGQQWTATFQLQGNNGLYLDGRLYLR